MDRGLACKKAIPASGYCQVAGLHAADGSSRREDVPIVPHDPVDAMSGKLPVILMSLLGVAVLAMVGVGFWLSRPEPREIEVLADGADGCPGYSFASPASSGTEMISGADGSRSEATITIAAEEAFALSVCLGRVSELGTPDEAIEGALGEGDREQVGPLVDVSSAYGDATALTTRIGRMLLTDFYVEQDGWLHAVGYLRPEEVGDTY